MNCLADNVLLGVISCTLPLVAPAGTVVVTSDGEIGKSLAAASILLSGTVNCPWVWLFGEVDR